MTLPKITNQQQAILRLLYTYRFLDRKHIQTLLNHKDKRRIITWLKDLREKQYIEWIYNPDDFTTKNKPAIYYVSLNGIRYLRAQKIYPPDELKKRYKESTRKPDFISRSLVLAECCITLQTQSIGEVQYSYALEADYSDPDNDHHFLHELKPHLCFAKQEGQKCTNYLLEIFDSTTPRYIVKKRLKDYVEYLDSGDWERETEDSEPPIALVVCPTTSDLIYAKRRTQKLLDDLTDATGVHMRFTTLEKLKLNGVIAIIWGEAEASS